MGWNEIHDEMKKKLRRMKKFRQRNEMGWNEIHDEMKKKLRRMKKFRQRNEMGWNEIHDEMKEGYWRYFISKLFCQQTRLPSSPCLLKKITWWAGKTSSGSWPGTVIILLWSGIMFSSTESLFDLISKRRPCCQEAFFEAEFFPRFWPVVLFFAKQYFYGSCEIKLNFLSLIIWEEARQPLLGPSVWAGQWRRRVKRRDQQDCQWDPLE